MQLLPLPCYIRSYGSDAMGQSSDSGHLDCTGANSQEDFCSFVITGRRESVDSARLLLSFHIDYIKKLEDLEVGSLCCNLLHCTE
ncbi:unnamed protein product [Protopolystoma xenopodis]|uniref:Uncharacterized protein n=1 Tax=Protopolystoma xenopodis TaxID=117903 RepID=A0A448X5N7_9PLAT|nr:unnamed protein product [Protopolystoma xenopodis]